MTNNKFMGTFDNETEVLSKIEELKAQGSKEDDMYVMARDEGQISMVRGRTDVDYKSSEGNWMDKFMASCQETIQHGKHFPVWESIKTKQIGITTKYKTARSYYL
nr:general stress protein [Planococcus faecalis]